MLLPPPPAPVPAAPDAPPEVVLEKKRSRLGYIGLGVLGVYLLLNGALSISDGRLEVEMDNAVSIARRHCPVAARDSVAAARGYDQMDQRTRMVVSKLCVLYNIGVVEAILSRPGRD